MAREKAVTLYLETWQKRMLTDYVRSIDPKLLERVRVAVAVTIDFTKPVHLNTYRVVQKPGLEEDGFELYFTEAQRAMLQSATGLRTVSSMHVSGAQLANKTIAFR